MTSIDLSSLSRPAGESVSVERPRARVLTRVLLPAAIVISALGALAYAARESLRSAVSVTVAPAVYKARSAPAGDRAAPGEVVQAPGWIEADPYDVGVPALISGVVKELFVLEGQRVEAGQVVAQLIDDEAVLAKRQAEASVLNAQAALAQAEATSAMEHATYEEAQDASQRRENASSRGAVAEGELVSLRLKAKAQEAATRAAEAAVARAHAEVSLAQVALDQADLALARTQVKAPTAGVVLARLVIPGQRLMPDANNPFAGVVVRLYDPAHLQVRVDVPLADAAKVRLGETAEITTETMPDRVFHGTVTRFVHEANLQKNTVQVKVAISDPAPELKPEMLARARVTVRSRDGARDAAGADGAAGVLVVPRQALFDVQGREASAWVVDRETSSARRARVTIGASDGETAEVREGLHPGDRVIVNAPAGLKAGTKVDAHERTEGR